MSSSSSDSSEDENIERFKEALDVRFISDSMYSTNGKSATEKKDSKDLKQLPSNRPVAEEFVSHLKVTPEFQSYVSKQLSKLLDEPRDSADTNYLVSMDVHPIETMHFSVKLQIKEVVKKKPTAPETGAEDLSGIYLLKGSKCYLNGEEPSDDFIPRKKCKFKPKKRIDDTEEDMSGVVVTPEWVLNQEGTKGWQKNAKKSPLFCYKKSKKGLLELTSETS